MLYSRSMLIFYFKYSNMYMSISNSQTIPSPHLSPLAFLSSWREHFLLSVFHNTNDGKWKELETRVNYFVIIRDYSYDIQILAVMLSLWVTNSLTWAWEETKAISFVMLCLHWCSLTQLIMQLLVGL